MKLSRFTYSVFSLAIGMLFVAALLLLLNSASPLVRAAPDTFFVTPSGSGDCSQSSPCDLQSALGAATGGDTIYVAGGTYTGAGGAVVTVTHSVSLYGGWDGTTTVPPVRNPDAHPATLNGEDARRVIYVGGDASPTVDGFIITGGKSPDGGGIHVYAASPVIQNNVITANSTITSGTYANGRGGGIFVGGGSSAVIAQNRILSNVSGYGGGIYHADSPSITVVANEIAGNAASRRGGGILIERSPDSVRANVISGNTAGNDGGGLLIWDAGGRVEANQIVGNSANYGGGISLGNNATPDIFNNLMVGNARDGLGVSSSSPVVVNNTIVGSGEVGSGYGVYLRSSSDCNPPYCTTGDIINNIVVSYAVGILGSGPITPVIDYNDMWANVTAEYSMPGGVVLGIHNISLNPLFVDPAIGDYHLQDGSPCVDAGDPAGVPPAPSMDIDGNPRPVGARVDIGADEYVAASVYLPSVLKNYTP
jgi:hypothetical protein